MLRNINWADPKSHITDHFTVHEALYLPSWDIYHTPSQAECAAILDLLVTCEKARTLLGDKPWNVHCIIRPNKVNCPTSVRHGQDYNAFIGSTAKHSPHIMGMAIDFDEIGVRCDETRSLLLPHLEQLGMRMEQGPGSNWVHLDRYSPNVSGGVRFFKP